MLNVIVESDQLHMTLFNVDTPYQTLINQTTISDSKVKMSNLEKESLGMDVLDSEWSRTVANWFNVFSDTLNKRKVKYLIIFDFVLEMW